MTARPAVALKCFSQFCEMHKLHHAAINAFVDHLWEFPLIQSDRWDDWEHNHPDLVETALGYSWPNGFESFLTASGVGPAQFRDRISLVVEIVFSSFYGATDDAFSLKCLSEVLTLAQNCGIDPPPAAAFSQSRLKDRHGWGNQTTKDVRDAC